jgi:ATP-dependent Lon protease
VKEVEKILVDFISARNAPEEKNPTPASTPAQPKDELSDKEKAKIDDAVNKKVNETLSKQQREFYLKEKIKAIREEIGKITPTESDAAAYRFRIETNPYPQYIKDKVLSEISKLESSSQQESGSIKTYIE